LAQSLFQVGGNFGQALGPLLAAFFVLPRGQSSLAWFAIAALAGMAILAGLGQWYKSNGLARPQVRKPPSGDGALSSREVHSAIVVLIALIFSKFFYLASITSYYTFYLIERFKISTQTAQIYLFVFLAAVAAGTIIGGPVGDRFGRKAVIWVSILGVLPFTLALPYVGLMATVGLSIVIGIVLASAFPAILVYAQELMPGRVGMVSGLFFGVAFGMGGVGAAALGVLADWTSIAFVYRVCSFLPLIGLLTTFLPNVDGAWGRARSRA
jgi:FSR family fosmidomycin resistance protein-like MFS transporter